MIISKNDYIHNVIGFCQRKGYHCELLEENVLKVTTKLEKWIVFVKGGGDKYEKSLLYHYNYFYKHKNKYEKYPDYHLQFERFITPMHIVEYMERHESKWNRPLYANNFVASAEKRVNAMC